MFWSIKYLIAYSMKENALQLKNTTYVGMATEQSFCGEGGAPSKLGVNCSLWTSAKSSPE